MKHINPYGFSKGIHPADVELVNGKVEKIYIKQFYYKIVCPGKVRSYAEINKNRA